MVNPARRSSVSGEPPPRSCAPLEQGPGMGRRQQPLHCPEPALCGVEQTARVLADAASLPVLRPWGEGLGRAGFSWSNQAGVSGHVAEDASTLDEGVRSPALHNFTFLEDNHPRETTAPSPHQSPFLPRANCWQRPVPQQRYLV